MRRAAAILAQKRGRGIFFVFEEIKGELLEHWNLILMAVCCNLANFINTIKKKTIKKLIETPGTSGTSGTYGTSGTSGTSG